METMATGEDPLQEGDLVRVPWREIEQDEDVHIEGPPVCLAGDATGEALLLLPPALRLRRLFLLLTRQGDLRDIGIEGEIAPANERMGDDRRVGAQPGEDILRDPRRPRPVRVEDEPSLPLPDAHLDRVEVR